MWDSELISESEIIEEQCETLIRIPDTDFLIFDEKENCFTVRDY